MLPSPNKATNPTSNEGTPNALTMVMRKQAFTL